MTNYDDQNGTHDYQTEKHYEDKNNEIDDRDYHQHTPISNTMQDGSIYNLEDNDQFVNNLDQCYDTNE